MAVNHAVGAENTTNSLATSPSPTASADGVIPPSAAHHVMPADMIDPREAKKKNGRLVQDLGDGRKAELTILPPLQNRAKAIMQQAEVPYGAFVAIEPSTGRVLAYASHSDREPSLTTLPLLANPPAASVFKVITSAALLEHANINPDREVCYRGDGGRRGLRKVHLQPPQAGKGNCQSLSKALGKSTNAVFGRLATEHLKPGILEAYARRFGFDRQLPFALPVEVSSTNIPRDEFAFAKTSAGFYHSQLSPVHGALIAATIGNGGVMVAPQLVNRYFEDGEVSMEFMARPMGRSVSEQTARTLAGMMVNTTESGTAGPYFRKRSRSLQGIDVAGKTGSLSAKGQDGERHFFSWFIGFAPAKNPRIAVAALIVNIGPWRIKSSYLAREALETYFANEKAGDLSAR
jgi:cell division protein FtsI/penicillin-binding protein 2